MSAVISAPRGRGELRWALADTAILVRRILSRIVREPEALVDVTVQPVLFVLMFAYVFGGAIVIPGGGSYHEYLIGGMLGTGIAATAPGTAVAMVADLSSGLIDRFRSLPMSRAAVIAARTVAELLTQVIGVLTVAAVGLAIGWRTHGGLAGTMAAFGLALAFGYAFSWVGVFLGLILRSAEGAQQVAFLVFMPMMFISSAFVPTQGMPAWLRTIADWNPLSALAAASRHLFRNPNPAALSASWPMRHPEEAILIWSATLLAVFVPLAIAAYRRKSYR